MKEITYSVQVVKVLEPHGEQCCICTPDQIVHAGLPAECHQLCSEIPDLKDWFELLNHMRCSVNLL